MKKMIYIKSIIKLFMIFILFAYKVNAENGWSPLGNEGFSTNRANFTSIAVDQNNTTYVVYQDNVSPYGANVKYFNGVSWNSLGNANFSIGSALYTNIEINNNIPYVVFQDGNNSNKISVMKFDGNNWIYVGIPGFSLGAVNYPNLKFDNNNNLYVAFSDVYNNNSLSVMKFDGNNWIYVGSPGFYVPSYNRINFDNNNNLFVSFSDGNNGGTVLKHNGINWVNLSENSSITNGYAADQIDLAINNLGELFVSYGDSENNNKITVKKYNGSQWILLDNGVISISSGFYNNIEIDKNNNIIIVYLESGISPNKAVAKLYNGVSWNTLGAGGFTNDEAKYIDLVIDNNNQPLIAFSDELNLRKISVYKYDDYQKILPSNIPKNGLIGYWPFNGNANDESGNGHNGTVTGAALVTDRFGNPNKAYSFDGVNDFISLGNWFNYNTFSISMWVKPDDQNGHAVIIDNYHSSSNNFVCQAIANWQTNGYNFCNSNDFYLTKGNWSHLVLVYASGQAKVYLNGTLVSQTNWTLNYNNPPSLNLGYWQPANARFWKGIIDEVTIWDRAITEQEISNIYNPLPANIPTTGLLAYYPFNGNANDESGNGNNGTIVGATPTINDENTPNTAYFFNGLSSFIDLPNEFANGEILSNQTFRIKFKYTESGVYTLWNKDGDWKEARIIIDDDNSIALDWKHPNLYGQGVQTNPNTVLPNVWNDVVIVVANNNIDFYINNIRQLGYQIYNFNSSEISYGHDGSCGIQYGYNRFGFDKVSCEIEHRFKGILDEFGLWNRALTPLEITNLFGASVPPLSAEPTIQSKSITFHSITKNRIGLRWTKGNGNKRVVLTSMGTLNNAEYLLDGSGYTAGNFGVNTLPNNSNVSVVYIGDNTTCLVEGLARNTTYYFRIMEYNGENQSANYLQTTASSNPSSKKTNKKESEEEISSSLINVYPNPVNDVLNIEFSKDFNNIIDSAKLTIINEVGQEVYSTKNTNNLLTINTLDLVNGVYHIIISNDNESIYHSFVIER